MKKKLIGLALFAGAVAVATKTLTAKKSEWKGLSESEVRQKVETRIPSRVPEDKRTALADRVVATMRDRGVLGDEAQPTAVADTTEAADDQPQANDAGPEAESPSQDS
jgi:hypothetical protein